MFTGTVRDNLDPFHHHTDAELTSIIKTVGLAKQTTDAGGLDGIVSGFGSDSWSLGQMQLVCLARAALNDVPIVCMDEATAALDPHTEHQVLVRIPSSSPRVLLPRMRHSPLHARNSLHATPWRSCSFTS